MTTGQSAMAFSGCGVKAGEAHSICVQNVWMESKTAWYLIKIYHNLTPVR